MPPSKKPKSRLRGCDFILDDVDVDDDDDEGFDDFDEAEDLGIDPREHAEAERVLREQESRGGNKRRRRLFEDMDEEHLEDYFKERYSVQTQGPSSSSQCDEIAQASIMPTMKDPNLWIVKCAAGAEQMCVMQLLRKFIALKRTSNPLEITSAFVRHNMKGKGLFYVEALKRSHVIMAIDGIRACWNAQQIAMVPKKEMIETLQVVNNVPELQRGDYVRVTRTVYKGDLGQVDYIDPAKGKVDLRLVPRIDCTRKRGLLRDPNERRAGKQKYTGPFRRPPPKLFDAEKIRELGGTVTDSGSFQYFEAGRFLNGFIYKTFTLSQISTDEVHPSVSELKMFDSDTADGIDLSDMKVRTGKTAHSIVTGDVVQVIEGEMVGLIGQVRKVEGDNIHMFPRHKLLTEEILVQADELRKYFKVGDQVKVIGGTQAGAAGFVVKVDEYSLVIISNESADGKEVKLLKKDARMAE